MTVVGWPHMSVRMPQLHLEPSGVSKFPQSERNEGRAGTTPGNGDRLPIRPIALLGASEPKVSVVMPAKNEALNLPYVFAGLPQDLHEVILVDGGSRTTR